jgi:hypothetical protein
MGNRFITLFTKRRKLNAYYSAQTAGLYLTNKHTVSNLGISTMFFTVPGMCFEGIGQNTTLELSDIKLQL